MGVLQPPKHPPLPASIRDVSLSRKPHAASRKLTQLTLSAPRSSESRNVPPTRHQDPTQHSHPFVITGVIFWLLTPL